MHVPFQMHLDGLQILSTMTDQENQFLLDMAAARSSKGQSYLIGEGLIEGLRDPMPCREALRSFLSALPLSNLQAATVLVCMGRDKHPSIEAAVEANTAVLEDVPAMARLIVHRRKRMEYLNAALQRLPAGCTERLPREVSHLLRKRATLSVE